MKTNLNVSSSSEEILLPIQGYEGLYSISNIGRVFSHKRNRYLRPCKGAGGYLHVSLSKGGKVKNTTVHRLILSAFSPRDNSDSLDCNHLNGVKDDNRLENLEWVTRSENLRHSVYVLGNVHIHTPKAVAQFSRNGTLLKVYRSTMDASRATGVPNGDVCQCAKGRLSHAGGYVWKYVSEEEAA